MIKRLPILILLSFISLATMAQPTALNCGNGRYVTDIFTNITKTTGITYGSNGVRNYFTGTSTPVTLRFDFYEPTGDVATKRPLIILAFGGSFITGQRSDLDTLCKSLSKKGYTTATIDYRLLNPDLLSLYAVSLNPAYLVDEVIKACADMKAAIRYFKRDAATVNQFKIDTTKIMLGGYSAGAITALQTAYADNIQESDLSLTNPNNALIAAAYQNNGIQNYGYIEGNTDIPGDSLLRTYRANGIAGVFSIAGGVSDSSLIDTNNPPLFAAHGTLDTTVYYNYGPANTTSFNLYGGGLMRVRSNNVRLNNQLYTIVNGNHQSPVRLDSVYLRQIIDSSAKFFQTIVCSTTLPVSLTSFTVENSNCSAVLNWQTTSESKSSRYEVEVSTDSRQYMRIGVVSSKNAANGASYSYNYKGFEGTAYFRLKMVDADGSYTYSPVQKLSLPCNLTTVQVYPNPAKEQTLITGLKTGMQVQLVNAQGQKLLLQKAATSAMQLSLSAFSSGLYLVQVVDTNGKIINNIKLMKE